jgi:hypothetical protein
MTYLSFTQKEARQCVAPPDHFQAEISTPRVEAAVVAATVVEVAVASAVVEVRRRAANRIDPARKLAVKNASPTPRLE